MVRVGKAVVTFSKEVDYGTTATMVLEVDPMEYAPDSVTDWEGYIYIKELSGNAITYELRKAVDDVEVAGTPTSLAANSSTDVMLVESVKYRLYLSSTATGKAKVAVRLTFYGLR